MSRLGTETAFEVLARARALEAQGREIVHLEIREPDFDTPAISWRPGSSAAEWKTHLLSVGRQPELRKVIADYISETRRINVAPDQVVRAGGKPSCSYTILTCVRKAMRPSIPTRLPIYESMINFSGEGRAYAVDGEGLQLRRGRECAAS